MSKFIKIITSFWTKHFITIIVVLALVTGIIIGAAVAKLATPKVEVVTPDITTTEITTTEPPATETPELTADMEEKGKALRQAEICINGFGYSRKGLKTMLLGTYNYSEEAVEYALNNLTVDWAEQAYDRVISYKAVNPEWDYQRMYDQLAYEKFEIVEIEGALEKAGYQKKAAE